MAKENTEDRSKKALKSGMWYSASSICVKAIAIITTPIFTRMMTKGEYGIASNFMAWYSILIIFCSLNLTYSIGRAKLDFEGKLEEYVGSMQLLSFITTGVICIATIPFIGKVADLLDLTVPLVYILMVNLLFHPAVSFTQSKFRYSYRYKGNIAIAAFTTISSVVVSLLLMNTFSDARYYAKVLGSVLPITVLALGFWIVNLKNNAVHINLEYWKYGLTISLPLIFHSISLYILSQSDRVMITKICGEDYNGIYTLAYGYAILTNIILSAVNEAWLPWFHDTYHDNGQDLIKKKVKPLVILGCMLGIGCIAIGPEAMKILGPEDYYDGRWAIAPITIGTVCQFIYQQYVHIELHMKKTKYISAGTVIAASLNLVLNLIFIPRFGYIAAAYTTLFCYFVLMIVHLTITRAIMKIHLYDDWFMFAAMGVTIAISAGFMFLYDTIVIRYVCLLLICLLYLVTNRQNIITIYNTVIKKKKK